MTALQVKQGDTFTKWIGLLSDADGWLDISAATSIKMAGKIQNGSTILGPVTVTAETTQAFTANLTAGSNVLTSVSVFTNIAEGSTILGTGPGVPALALVGSLDTTAATIDLVDFNGNPVNASDTATGVSLKANQGMTTYTPVTADTAFAGVYDCEFYVHFASGLLVVPNSTNTPTLIVNPALDLAGE